MIKSTGIRLTGNLTSQLDVRQAQKDGKALAKKLEKAALKVGKFDNVEGIDFNSKVGEVKVHLGDTTSKVAVDEKGTVQSFQQRKDPVKDQWNDDSMYFQGAKVHTNSNGTVTYLQASFEPEKPDSKFHNYVTEKTVLDQKGEVASYHKESRKTLQDTPQRRVVPEWMQEWNLHNPAERHGF